MMAAHELRVRGLPELRSRALNLVAVQIEPVLGRTHIGTALGVADSQMIHRQDAHVRALRRMRRMRFRVRSSESAWRWCVHSRTAEERELASGRR
jgi:hypothetical protein